MLNLDTLHKLAADFGVARTDVLLLAIATHGRFEQLTPARKAKVADASLRVWRTIGDDCARVLYLKIRKTQTAPHLMSAAA